MRTIVYTARVEFAFDPKKSDLLLQERGVVFCTVGLSHIGYEEGDVDELEVQHPNQARYPNQKVLVVELNDYTYCVPYVLEGDTWFLKTIYPSRRFKYLLEGVHQDDQI